MYDDLLVPHWHKKIYGFLQQPGWETGWKSNARNPQAPTFLHKHFAGSRKSDHEGEEQYDCGDELVEPLSLFWAWLMDNGPMRDHTLVRCYANGYPYGSDGTLHTDSKDPRSFTAIYYPHDRWSPNWGGETVFFNREETDVVFVAYPRPNRLVVFPGTIPHVARGVSRICPVMRITLMFKTVAGPGNGGRYD